jgi:glycosyltransferase involved in cell wall biosynthesis
MARVTVIVPAYNAASYLPEALNSVLGQSYADWEIIVSDDGSTDHTRAVVESLMPDFDGRLHYMYQTNRGQAAARNAAIRQATGEFFALLDADDLWLRDRLRLGINLMDSDAGMGLVHGKVARINQASEIIEHPPCPAPKDQRGRIARKIYTRRAHPLCPTVLFRKACVEKIGLFDETLCPCEDRDLWFRIAEHYSVGYLDEIVAHYRIVPNSSSRNWQRASDAQRRFIEKHRDRGSVSRLTARVAFANMYRERGDAIFNTGDTSESLRWYLQSLRFYPLNASNVYMFFRAVGELALRPRRAVRT